MPTPSWLVPVGERIRASATPANADGTLSFSNGWQVADSAQQKGVSDTLKQLHPGGGRLLTPRVSVADGVLSVFMFCS